MITGPNKVSLIEAQHNYQTYGASEAFFRLTNKVGKPGPYDLRDLSWRPIDPQIDDVIESQEDVQGPTEWPTDLTSLYYWRETFWKRRR
jgi:hypothetical protein